MNSNLLDTENIELELLLTAINLKYGYDFREYSRASIKRRIKNSLQKSGLKTLSDLQREILYRPDFFQSVLHDVSVNVTEMFRDPLFYKTLRETILPQLGHKDLIKIWHAGCASGEEVYSMAICLKETGLFHQARVYATDFDDKILAKAVEGVYPIQYLKQYIRNYQESGGKESFSIYYKAAYDWVSMDQDLVKNVHFANHNLVTDGVFSEVDLVICRNVLIYFRRELQDHVIGLFKKSLCSGGFLCLGTKETVRLSSHSETFKDVIPKEKIYQRI